MLNRSTIHLIKTLSDHISITGICEILDISRATYYRHLNKKMNIHLQKLKVEYINFALKATFFMGIGKFTYCSLEGL
ncbi:helix-turn-helix domain-containing protein [Pediococcus claussenii]|uniref:helix-turn-helix domain-containing protein n=1 Tax=Pediococcus claussenii TaxID=187452 RepID=UPI000AE70C11